MTRHAIPRHIPLLALVALAAGPLIGCGGGQLQGASATATSTAATTGTAAAHAPKTSTTPAPSAKGGNTATTPTPKLTPKTFVAAPITRPKRSQLAKTGQVTIPVAVGGPGKVSAFGQALIGKAIVRVANAPTVVAKQAGFVTLTLQLTSAARAQLAAGKGMLMYVGVMFSKGRVVQRLTVPLKPA